jgi:hypothetical protein
LVKRSKVADASEVEIWETANARVKSSTCADSTATALPNPLSKSFRRVNRLDKTKQYIPAPLAAATRRMSAKNGYFAICVGGLFSGHASTAPDVVQ